MAVFDVVGIDGTGATDVTADLLAFIASCPDGVDGEPNVIRFGENKTYRVDYTLRITLRNWLVFDGNGSTFKTDIDAPYGVPSQDRTRTHWWLFRCTGIRLTNMTIRGSNANAGLSEVAWRVIYEAQHGVLIQSCLNTTIDHVTMTKICGDFFYFGVGPPYGITDGVLVENCKLIDNGRQGFSFIGCRNVEVRHCETVTVRRSTMDFEPNGVDYPAFNVHVHHNTFGEQRLSFIASQGQLGECSDVIVDSNTAWAMKVVINPPAPNSRKNWTITNNVGAQAIGNSGGNAWWIGRVDGLTVTGNTQPLQAGRNMYLCELDRCTNYNVSGNTLPGGIGQFFTNDPSDPVLFPGICAGTRFRLSDASKLALAAGT